MRARLGLNTGRWSLSLLLALAVLAACWKLIASGPSCGHDFDFHLLSWMEVAQQWHRGVLYPHWLTTANYGAGEPRFVFYPPLSWMLGGLLGASLGGTPASAAGWQLTPLLFTALALSGCGLSMYRLAQQWLPRNVAARASVLYVLSPYSLFVAYERTAYGELLAAAALPLVLLFALRSKPSAVPLALAFATVWLANAPAGVMAGYMLAFVTVIAAIQRKSLRPLARGAGGGLLGLGLAGFYLVPAAWERRWVEIERAVGPGMRIRDSFLFGHSGEAFHNQVLSTASWIAVFLLLVSFAAAAVLMLRHRRSNRGSDQGGGRGGEYPDLSLLFVPVISLLPLILFLLLPLSGWVWAHAPELAFLQFPWRWLLVAEIAYALLAAAVLRGQVAFAVALLPLVLLGALQAQRFYQPCDEEDAVDPQMTVFKTGAGIEGTDEYVSRNVDNGGIQKGLPEVRVLPSADADSIDSSVALNPPWSPASEGSHEELLTQGARYKVARWEAERRSIEVHTDKAAFAVLRLMDYPAWRVRVNGADVPVRPHRDDGLLTIPVAAGLSRIEISYEATNDVWAGRLLSVAAALVMLFHALLHRRMAAASPERRGAGQVS